MNAKEKEFYDIVFKNCTEKEIYAILLKKKEIDDKTPKLRTPDDNKMLKSLFYKMSKYSKDLIADIKKKCPSLQRKPKTAEQRKEQTSGSRPLWARSKFGLWYAALGVVKMLHTDNKQQIRK